MTGDRSCTSAQISDNLVTPPRPRQAARMAGCIDPRQKYLVNMGPFRAPTA